VLLSPASLSSLTCAFAPLFWRELCSASLATLEPTLATKRYSCRVFPLVGINGRRFAGCIADDGRGELVHVGRAFARPLGHPSRVALGAVK
jgi:hypothetical protein